MFRFVSSSFYFLVTSKKRLQQPCEKAPSWALSQLPIVTGVLVPQAGPSAVCHAHTSHSFKSWYSACRWRCCWTFAIGGIVGRIDPTQEPRVAALGIPPREEAASLLWPLWLESCRLSFEIAGPVFGTLFYNSQTESAGTNILAEKKPPAWKEATDGATTDAGNAGLDGDFVLSTRGTFVTFVTVSDPAHTALGCWYILGFVILHWIHLL